MGHDARFPKRAAEPGSAAAERSSWTTQLIAKNIIYDDIRPAEIERRIEAARRRPASNESRKDLDALLPLSKGVEAHEQLNRADDAWREEIARQLFRRGVSPHELSRTEVAAQFELFNGKERLLAAEQETLHQYEDFLAAGSDGIALTEKIVIQRSDIEVLMNDIRVRIAERTADDEARHAELLELDKELVRIIEAIPREDWGKRYELQEIFLIRRLIHTADTGHLMTVSHGTLREDLRPDRGSVDFEITAGGDHLAFQAKTFNTHASGTESRAAQYETIRRLREHAPASTHVVVLETREIQRTYENAVHELNGTKAPKRGEKFEALKPITDSLRPSERTRVLALLGFSEETLREEQAAFDAKYEGRLKLEEELALRREEERQREADLARAEREREEEVRRQEEEVRIRHELEMHRQREATLAAQRERDAIVDAKEQRIAAQQHARAVERIAAAQRAIQIANEEANRAAEAAKKEAARRKREERERNAPDWPPKTMEGLGTSENLMRLGMLPPDWKNDALAFLRAKKQFLSLFAKPRIKSQAPTDKDKPGAAFGEAFPTKERFEKPTDADRERLQSVLRGQQAA
jgi:hypothetical protein